MKTALCFLTFVAGLTALAVPEVSEVTVGRKAGSRLYEFRYALSNESAIVTADIMTNTLANGAGEWVRLPETCQRHLAGAVNVVVTNLGENVVYWCPDKAWPFNEITDGRLGVRLTAWPKNDPPDYLLADLRALDVLGGYGVTYYTSADALPYDMDSDVLRTDFMLFRRIHAAGKSVALGSPAGEKGRASGTTEQVRRASFVHDFYLAVFELTQGQLNALKHGTAYAGSLSNDLCRLTRPCDTCFWYDSKAGSVIGGNASNYNNPEQPDKCYAADTASVIGCLRRVTGFGENVFLPTEAQWEFACRAGTTTAYSDGSEWKTNAFGACETLDRLGRYCRNGGLVDGVTLPDLDVDTEHGTARVGSYAPNAFGLYDMEGNVWEFARDHYVEDRRTLASQIDPVGPPSASAPNVVIRGGSYFQDFNGTKADGSPKESVIPASRYAFSPTAFDYSLGVRFSIDVDGSPASTTAESAPCAVDARVKTVALSEFVKIDTLHGMGSVIILR